MQSDPMQPAFAAFHSGRLDETERLCREVIGADPRRFEAHHLLAVIAARHGRQDEALANYDRALAIRPDEPQALSNRGVTLGELGRHEAALASYDKALALRPDYAPALSNRGNTLRALKRFDEALATYERALTSAGDFPEGWSNRGTTLHDMGRYAEALASYDRALALRPGYAHAWSNRGLALQQLGRLREALTSYDKALAIQPDYRECQANRDEVLAVLETADEREPQSGTAAVPQTPAGYVISLARRPDRRERFLRWNAGKGIDISVFDAVDGRMLDKETLLRANIIDDLNLNFTMGFLGSAMSHRALWEKCIVLGQPILIFEDDVFLPDTLGDWIEPALEELAGGCDIVFLGYNRDAVLSVGYGAGQWCNIGFEPPTVGFEQEARQHSQWSRPRSHCLLDTRLVWGITAYAITPASAAALLLHCFPLSNKRAVRMYGAGRVLVPYGIDGMVNLAIQLGLIRARVVFPPLAIGPNDPADSDNYTQPG
jgi:tetratricopeptide (TPR) repeat protein